MLLAVRNVYVMLSSWCEFVAGHIAVRRSADGAISCVCVVARRYIFV